jgi:hypothetical protein
MHFDWLIEWTSGLTLPQRLALGAGAIGLLFALLVFLWCHRLLGRRRPAADQMVNNLFHRARVRGAGAPPGSLEEEPDKDPFVFGSRGEKRYALRRQGNPVAVVISDEAAKAPPWHGLVLDRSIGGMRIAMDEPVELGRVLSIRPEKSTALIPWVQVEVRACRKVDIGWEVGCQFVRTPPSSVLWSFG